MYQCWVVIQRGIITHFHASIPLLWNVTLYSVSFCFALAVLSPSSSTSVFPHCDRLLSFTPPPLCFLLTTVSFSTLLFLHPHRVSLYLLSVAHSLCFTCFGQNWYLAQMNTRSVFRPIIWLFYWSGFSAPVRTGTSWMCPRCSFKLMMSWGDTFWNWPTNAEAVDSPTFSLRY